MKLSLTVMSAGKLQNQVIWVQLPEFVIGRGPQCHLRPANPIISKRHCALIMRGDEVFVRDFDSTNGTFVNKATIKGESQLKDNDCLEVGPLAFRVHIDRTTPINEPTPLPPSKRGAKPDDEEVAALWLSMHDEGSVTAAPEAAGTVHDPEGSTILENGKQAESTSQADQKSGGANRHEAAKAAAADTSAAAKVILDKYLRRPRT